MACPPAHFRSSETRTEHHPTPPARDRSAGAAHSCCLPPSRRGIGHSAGGKASCQPGPRLAALRKGSAGSMRMQAHPETEKQLAGHLPFFCCRQKRPRQEDPKLAKVETQSTTDPSRIPMSFCPPRKESTHGTAKCRNLIGHPHAQDEPVRTVRDAE